VAKKRTNPKKKTAAAKPSRELRGMSGATFSRAKKEGNVAKKSKRDKVRTNQRSRAGV